MNVILSGTEWSEGTRLTCERIFYIFSNTRYMITKLNSRRASNQDQVRDRKLAAGSFKGRPAGHPYGQSVFNENTYQVPVAW
jgi:hypothetical protein